MEVTWLAHAGAYHLEMPGLPVLEHHEPRLLEKMKWPN